MIQTSFETALKKGAIGEGVVRAKMESKGYVVYTPATKGAHAFDLLAIKDKKKCIALDVKAKARRIYYDDTGIDERLYKVYKSFSVNHNMPFWIVFVDEFTKTIYGNCIDELDSPYKCTSKGIIYPLLSESRDGKVMRYWHLSKMLYIADITDDIANELKEYSQRSYGYEKETE